MIENIHKFAIAGPKKLSMVSFSDKDFIKKCSHEVMFLNQKDEIPGWIDINCIICPYCPFLFSDVWSRCMTGYFNNASHCLIVCIFEHLPTDKVCQKEVEHIEKNSGHVNIFTSKEQMDAWAMKPSRRNRIVTTARDFNELLDEFGHGIFLGKDFDTKLDTSEAESKSTGD